MPKLSDAMETGQGHQVAQEGGRRGQGRRRDRRDRDRQGQRRDRGLRRAACCARSSSREGGRCRWETDRRHRRSGRRHASVAAAPAKPAAPAAAARPPSAPAPPPSTAPAAAPPRARPRGRPAPGDGDLPVGARPRTAVMPMAPAAAAPASGPAAASRPRRSRARSRAQTGVDLHLRPGDRPGRPHHPSATWRPPAPRPARRPRRRAPRRPRPRRCRAPAFVIPPRPEAEYEDVPMSAMRAAIAKRMPMSKAPVPHFYVTSEVDMDAACGAPRAAERRSRGSPRSR